MRKLALSDEILMTVEKPARYIGGEVNAVMKDKDQVDIRFAMCFPDVYEIGMSHLGIQILYDMFNRREDTWCERVYSPWPDLHKVLKEKQIPLFALESQDPVKKFDFLGITIQYEMCYTNILQILDLSGIPLSAEDRTMDDPFVIGGGPCTYNPEPLAEFFDLFYIGEGETQYFALLDLYKEWKNSGKSRQDFLKAAAQIPGIYVPSLYEVTYAEDGTIAKMKPICPEAPEKVKKQIVMDVIISATASPHYTVTYGKLSKVLKTEKPRVLIDLAVPIDIEAKVEQIPGVKRFDVDDFQELAKVNNEKKQHEVQAADQILAEIQKDFERWMVFQLSLPKIEQLKKRMLEEAEKKGFERAIDKMLYKLRDHSEPSELYAFFSHMEEND